MKLKTKILSLIMAVVMLASVSAMAAPSWKFSGYDLAHGNPYAILEYEVDDNGVPTGNARQNGYANKVEWKHAFYEAVYPHMGYDQLYLDGAAQELYTPSFVAKSEQEFRPIYWEARAPYAVYDIMYSRIPGILDWTVQNYVQFGNRNADVKKEWVDYGFSAFKTDDGAFVDVINLLTDKAVAAKFDNVATYNDVVNSYFNLYALDNKVQAPGFEIDFIIPKVDQEKLTGPNYDNGVVNGDKVVYAMDEIVKTPANVGFYNVDLLTNDIRTAEVEWIYGGYEAEGLNKIYEVAEIDGVLMDGSACTKLVWGLKPGTTDWGWIEVASKKPYIARYTGGVATPDVAWKAVWPEAAYPFSVYERKMVKNLAGEMVWTNEYRPSGKYAAILPSFEIEGTYPEDGKRNLVLTLTSDLVENFDIEKLIGTDYDYVGSGVYVFNGQKVPEFQNNLITNHVNL